MLQVEKYDSIIHNKFKKGEFQIDPNRGVVKGKLLNNSGERKEIGYIIGKSKKFTFIHNCRSYAYPVNRAIYLCVHGSIPESHLVYNIDADVNNNKLCNLAIKKATSEIEHYIRVWSKEELSKLKRVCKYKSYKELSDMFGRSIKSIRHAVRKIDIDKKDNRRKWEKQDDQKLQDMLKIQKKSIKDIAEEMGKSENSIRMRINRFNGKYRSDTHLQETFKAKNFYISFKSAKNRGTLESKCCLCEYDKYVELHHIDNDNKNHHISNIATLCPNHHVEITMGEHKGEILYAIWKRKYSDGSLSEEYNNLKEVQSQSV